MNNLKRSVVSTFVGLAVFGSMSQIALANSPYPGSVIIKDAEAKIKSGMTGDEVVHEIGEPMAKPVWMDKSTTWTYNTENASIRFDVDFDKNGKVKSSTLYQRSTNSN